MAWDSQASTILKTTLLALALRCADIYLLCVRVCLHVCVRVRSRVCAHVIFVRSCNCVGFFLLFLPCYNLLLVWAQFLWSPVIVCVCVFFPSLMCYIFVVGAWLRVGSRGCLWVCERAILWAPELCFFSLFLLSLLVCYIFIVRAYVWDRVPVRALLFLWAPATVFFKSLPSFVWYILLRIHTQFLWAPTIVFFPSPRCWCVMFFFCECVIACESTWLHALAHAP